MYKGRRSAAVFVVVLASGCKSGDSAVAKDTISWPEDTLAQPPVLASKYHVLSNRTDDPTDPKRLRAKLPSGWTTEPPEAATSAVGPRGEVLKWQYLAYSGKEREAGPGTVTYVLAEQPEASSKRLVLRPWAGFITRQESMIFDGDDRVMDVASYRAYTDHGIMVGTFVWPAEEEVGETEAQVALAYLLATLKVDR